MLDLKILHARKSHTAVRPSSTCVDERLEWRGEVGRVEWRGERRQVKEGMKISQNQQKSKKVDSDFQKKNILITSGKNYPGYGSNFLKSLKKR